MTPREVIAEAWAITRREVAIRRWGCTTSFFELLLNIKLISYQVYFVYEWMRGSPAGFFDVEIHIYENLPHWFFWTFILTFIVLVCIEFLFPHLAHGAMIGLAAKSHMGEPVQGGTVLALYNFFQMFAIHEFFLLASLPLAITLISLVLRYIEGDSRIATVIIILIVWAFSNVLKFFFSFAQEAVVIDRAGIFEALGRSFKLIISYMSRIMFLIMLLIIISLRVFLNAMIVLVIPALVLSITFLLSLFLSPLFTWIIAGTIGLALVLVMSYFFGYLNVFKHTVWTIMYIELRKHKDLDMIG